MAAIWHTDNPGKWYASLIPMDSRYVMVERPTTRRGARDAVRRAPRFTPRKRLTSLARHANALPKMLLVRTGRAADEKWFAIPYPGSRLRRDGGRVDTGLAHLADRDVISLDGPGADEWVFTTERLAHIEVYTGERGLHCPRCKLEVCEGESVVACPGCGTLHHQDDAIAKPCWTYAPGCALCARDTSLADSAYAWTPDEL